MMTDFSNNLIDVTLHLHRSRKATKWMDRGVHVYIPLGLKFGGRGLLWPPQQCIDEEREIVQLRSLCPHFSSASFIIHKNLC